MTRSAREVVGEIAEEVRNPIPVGPDWVYPACVGPQNLAYEFCYACEREGKWSVRQVLRHLADSEIVWGYRLRMVWAEDRPRLTGYDQDAWADRLAYADAEPAESLAEFGILRRSNLRLLRSASEADRQRAGVHLERGEETLEQMIELYAGHDLLHLRQIERIRAAVAR